jgi:hypothetical protein
MDPCFYRRDDALIIVHLDDMCVAADPDTLTTFHVALFDRFQITTSNGTRFLGMDVDYNRELGFEDEHENLSSVHLGSLYCL